VTFPAQDPAEAYVYEDDRLPLLVFGALSLVSRGAEIEIEGTRLALPRPLLASRPGMPDPGPRRADVADLLRRLTAADPEAR